MLLVLAVGVHLGNGLAQLSGGQGWTWPAPSQLFAGIPAVLSSAPMTGRVGVRAWVMVVELLLIGGLAWAGFVSWHRWGPSRLKGVATQDQAERVLGVTRLRKVAPIVRPDIHPVRGMGGSHGLGSRLGSPMVAFWLSLPSDRDHYLATSVFD